MSIDVRASGSNLELWHVQLGGGVVRTMSLDELDGAFQSGAINEQTMVLKAGALQWTTLGDVAGIDDQPNSIAPMATDIASSDLVMPGSSPVPFDVSFGTEELAVFKPKRRIGRALVAMALVASIGGGLFAIKSMAGLRAKVASVTALVKDTGGARAAAGAPLPQAQPPKATEPPPAAMALPPPAQTITGVSIDSLPPAPASPTDKKGKKTAEPAPRKSVKSAAKKSAKSTDPTQKGSGQFDPLNGNL